MQNKPEHPLDSVDHALQLLIILQNRGEVGVTEAARELSVAKSTAHRLLAMLRYREFAVQDRRRAYRPGPNLRSSRAASSTGELVVIARPHLVEMSEASRETTHIAALEGNAVRFLDGVQGPQGLRIGVRSGLLLPAHVTAAGRALLAELTDATLQMMYPRGLPVTSGTNAMTLSQLQHSLAGVRRRGYASNFDESERGVSALARCVHGPDGRAVASVAIAAPSVRVDRRRASEFDSLLCRATAMIELKLRDLPVPAPAAVGGLAAE